MSNLLFLSLTANKFTSTKNLYKPPRTRLTKSARFPLPTEFLNKFLDSLRLSKKLVPRKPIAFRSSWKLEKLAKVEKNNI